MLFDENSEQKQSEENISLRFIMLYFRCSSLCEKRFILRYSALFLLAVLLVGQTTSGELRVTVKDPSGAAVASSIHLQNQSTHTTQNVTIPANGRYTFKNLPFGFYQVQVSAAGFASASELIEIRSEVPQNRQIVLGVEQIETRVDVKESATLIDPNRTGAAYYVGSEQIKDRGEDMPGRGLIDLVAKQPGWSLEANGVLHPRESEYDTQYIVNGLMWNP